ncbi:MAG: 6,7-dimethyl-8-ribityllumazine synthase [Acidimicrobiia bacterium]
MGEYAAPADAVDGTGMRFGVVVARFNEDITEPLLDGVRRTFAARGVADDAVSVVRVPGAFELPLIAQQLARSGTVDGVICLGAVIRGDTPHFEYVAGEAARGLQDVALATGVPVVFGILTTNTHAQAVDRIGGSEGHKGEEAAATALEMVALLRSLPPVLG